jgi:hypothetical protein
VCAPRVRVPTQRICVCVCLVTPAVESESEDVCTDCTALLVTAKVSVNSDNWLVLVMGDGRCVLQVRECRTYRSGLRTKMKMGCGRGKALGSGLLG